MLVTHIHKEYVVVTNNCLKQVHAEKNINAYMHIPLQYVVSNGETTSLVLVKRCTHIGLVQKIREKN